MNERLDTKEEFAMVTRAKSFAHAGRGIYIFFKTTPNAWIHFAILTLVIMLGFYFDISIIEWLFIALAAGFVLVSEAFNTAIEIDIDLTSPEYHPYARDTKDVAAGAVLLSSLTSVVVGVLVFGKYLIAM